MPEFLTTFVLCCEMTSVAVLVNENEIVLSFMQDCEMCPDTISYDNAYFLAQYLWD